VWDAVLEILESELSRVNYDNWLRDTEALGLSRGHTTLIVQVANDEAVEVLSDRHSSDIERALSQALEHVEGDCDLARTLMSVAYVTEATLSKRRPQSEDAFAYPHAVQAQRLWQRALGDLAGQMTRATFDTWLHDSKAVGVNGDGQTLVICVKNQYAVQWLESKLYNVTHRTLVSHLEYDDGDEFADLGLTPESVSLRFVTSEMIAEESATVPETRNSDE
jgi:chromosomal replication initiation ATPase DnaA